MREKPSWPARLHGQESSRVTVLKILTDPCLEFMNILWPLITFFVVAFGEGVFYLHQLQQIACQVYPDLYIVLDPDLGAICCGFWVGGAGPIDRVGRHIANQR